MNSVLKCFAKNLIIDSTKFSLNATLKINQLFVNT